ncbi:FAD-dependent oxidoreductase [Pseudomonas aeruginosa]|uniref:FAD-dependent oxidoreductase n=1 Tax=Pseudomonas aeruginosa TaxID=287 RepID=UPI001C626FD4|nr:FAD-dependent oxidoreductase [Pseudomonas aeruginosa]
MQASAQTAAAAPVRPSGTKTYGIRSSSKLKLGAMYLAGEATHETLWGTVDGAWESGERAADAALRRIGGVKEAAPETPAPAAKHKRRTPRSAEPMN